MSKSTLKEKWGVMQSHLMTGISYMIPVVVGAGMLMGIGGIAGQILNVEIWSPEALNSSDALVSTFAWITQVAGKGLMNLMYPIFAAFLAYAIGDKLALAPGFLGGVLASEMGSGFVGSILIGLVAGYFVKFANENIKIKRKYIGIKTMFIIPVLGVIIVSLASKFIVGPIGVGFINGITAIINAVGQAGGAALSALLGGAMAFAHIGVPASIWGWPLIERPAGFFLGLLAGVIFVAVASVFRRLSIVKKEEKAQVK